MKLSNKKIIVSTLALAMGAALAGSISGSVAWYQYSTRAASQIIGTSAGTEGRLQVKKSTDADTAYSQNVTFAAAEFKPLSVKNAEGVLTFYEHPVYQYAQLATTTSGYADYTLNFRFQTNQTKTADAWVNDTTKNIYLSYFAIEPAAGAEVDVSDAVRVAFLDSTGKAKFILAKSSAAGTTDTAQYLDVNKDTRDDTTYWDCLDNQSLVTGDPGAPTKVEYTTGAASYSTNAHADALADVSDPYEIDSATGNSAKILSTTAVDNALTIRVWIEGFAEINSKTIWDRDTIAQSFNINMQFQCEADE